MLSDLIFGVFRTLSSNLLTRNPQVPGPSLMLALAHWSCFQQSRKERTILLLKNKVFTFDQGITNDSSHLQPPGAMGMGTSHQND